MGLQINNPPGRSGNGSYRFEGKLSYIGSDGSRKRRGVKITIGPVDEIKRRDAEIIADNIAKLIKHRANIPKIPSLLSAFFFSAYAARCGSQRSSI